jgi:hypothetical protein
VKEGMHREKEYRHRRQAGLIYLAAGGPGMFGMIRGRAEAQDDLWGRADC